MDPGDSTAVVRRQHHHIPFATPADHAQAAALRYLRDDLVIRAGTVACVDAFAADPGNPAEPNRCFCVQKTTKERVCASA